MNSLVVFGGRGRPAFDVGEQVVIDGATLRCGLVAAAAQRIDPRRPELAEHVLVRVSAISCNYRDRTIFLQMSTVPSSRYSSVGSEFVGEVIDVGARVTGLRVGDRVIPNHHYTGRGVDADGVREGIPTNRASRRLQLLPERKLIRIPPCMADDVAAGFSLGAQTAYSMVRRLDVAPGSNALVMGGSSNTGLFLIGALRRAGAHVYASTTNVARASRLLAAGAREVIVRSRSGTDASDASDLLRSVAERVGGFSAIADPFFDVHIGDAIRVLAPYGRYITCGLAAQNDHLVHESAPPRIHGAQILMTAMRKNLTIMGNCIGVSDDIARAVADYEAGAFSPVIDSVFDGDRVAQFLDRTYNDGDRFGKVVFRYLD